MSTNVEKPKKSLFTGKKETTSEKKPKPEKAVKGKKALTGNLAGVWRYRVGDYRILCDINDGRLVILVVDVAHRREVYKRR